jgi:hypothetical protein
MGTWRKSTHSSGDGGSCIEVADGGRIGVRDTKEAHLGNARTVIKFEPGAWRGFVASVRRGNAAR